MQTMHPVIVSGRHVLDTSIFPLDEFEDRLRQARESMDAHGLDGLVVYGNGENSAALTYLTNLAPRMRWALAFIPRQGEVELVVAGPERDLHFAQAATWVKSLTAYDKLEPVVRRWSDGLRMATARERLRLGFAGNKHVRQHVLDSVTRCLPQEVEAWVDVDASLDGLRATLRPRELRTMRSNIGRIEALAAMARQVVNDGGKAADAVRAVEKAGLLRGAHEVRTLFSRDAGLTLQPFERVEAEVGNAFAGFIARRELGYWAEALVSHNVEPEYAADIVEALSRMVAAAAAGVRVSDLEQLRSPRSTGATQHPFTSRGVAQLGLEIQEMAPTEKLQVGGIYSLRAGLVFPDKTGAIGSVIVLVHDDSVEVLLQSAPTATRKAELA
ncbi:aminopeptidase P family N-terminal domain-containing protein [Variovorax paradoxus]|uniref:Creatinase N-terminal domain-containing protein n=1 Tax=Variovorax paradoxus TaxID=34073 RepID=A0A0H2LR77_VARPD|nr:aminopeptidase P family N-terminal domain-containing protein [Variovorax paradoxus]KLN52813.1 hypothetical protein VPARA_60800 [Variovorax paradoxus]